MTGAGAESALLCLVLFPLKDFLAGFFFGIAGLRDKLLEKNSIAIPEGLCEPLEVVGREGASIDDLRGGSASEPSSLEGRRWDGGVVAGGSWLCERLAGL